MNMANALCSRISQVTCTTALALTCALPACDGPVDDNEIATHGADRDEENDEAVGDRAVDELIHRSETSKVDRLEYCATLDMIISCNDLSPEAELGAAYGWGSQGCGAYPPELLYAEWPSHDGCY